MVHGEGGNLGHVGFPIFRPKKNKKKLVRYVLSSTSFLYWNMKIGRKFSPHPVLFINIPMVPSLSKRFPFLGTRNAEPFSSVPLE